MDYMITGGSLQMSQRFFAVESFKSGSYLRELMGLDNPKSRKVQKITRDGNQVTIKYAPSDRVYVPDDFTSFFDDLKAAYGPALQGEIVVDMNMDFEFDDFSVKFNFV